MRRSWTELLLAFFALVACAGAFARMISGDAKVLERIDNTTLLYLGVAGAILLLREVKSFAFGDYKVEFERVREIAEEARTTAENAQNAALGKGRDPRDPQESEAEALRRSVAEAEGSDPWKGEFSKNADGTRRAEPNVDGSRRLDATVTRIQGAEDYFRIALTVRSTNPADPLRDAVQFFLHPTFRNPRPIVNVGPNGMAELHLTAWGAFTVGAITDNGKTKLELDLSELASAPEEFKNR